jgi:hypothetical protein
MNHFNICTGVCVCAIGLAATAPAVAADEPWLPAAREVAAAVPPKLLTVLTDAIAKTGAAQALTLCQTVAPQMASAASEATGWQVRRVSLRNRNPKAVPDAWERETLADFDDRVSTGESFETLERSTVQTVNGKVVQRYMRALPVLPMCIQCHGTTSQLAPGVAERLMALYPADKAVGYGVGQIRGAITLQRTP